MVATANDPEPPLWLGCQQCKSLYLSNPDGGRCPVGGQHDGSRSAHYRGGSSGAGMQDMGTACSRCRSVFYNGLRACPAGQAHDTSGSADYFIVVNIDWAPGQSGWRWCSQRYGLG